MSPLRQALLFLLVVVGVKAQIEYDPEFWDSFDDDIEPYEHPWKKAPDLINITNVEWYFNMTHQGILGVSRGIYNNDSMNISVDCFGPKFVVKINEFANMINQSWWENIILEGAIVYQMYYMVFEICPLDNTVNDIFIFCWNEGCYLDELWVNTYTKILYMTKAVIEALIVWTEGIPPTTNEDKEQWYALSR